MEKQTWVIGVTGASGLCYATRLIEVMAEVNHDLHVIFSDAALRVLSEEENRKISQRRLAKELFPDQQYDNITWHNPNDIGASIASGSVSTEGMVIVPCSMGTLAAAVNGLSQNLIHRAADVTLKEGRKLILVPRETPLSEIHLENMLKLSRARARIVPAMPGFYHQPSEIRDLVDMMVMKILDQMGIRVDLVERWKSLESVNDNVEPLRIAGSGE